MESSEVTVERPLTRTALHALGNVFLGVSAGLLVYYLVTDAVGRWRQAELRDQLVALGAVGAPSPDRLVPEQPAPEDPPSIWDTWRTEDVGYWAGLESDGVFGRLVIERMDLDAAVVRGVGTEELKRGPGWMPYTDIPGPTGNVGIAAHRTTFGAPFRRLDELVPGDTIYFFSPFRRYTYVVTEKFSVTPDRTEVVETTEEPMLTLSACHPPYSARYRLIVRSELTEVHRIVEAEESSE